LDATSLDICEFVTNDQYLLGVSTSNVVFNRNGSYDEALPGAKDFKLILCTNYSYWSAQWIDDMDPEWVDILNEDGMNIVGTDKYPSPVTSLYIRIAGPNNSGATRTAKFKLVAGTLVKEITITQNN
jgi:hypothetical protein